jgi:hypothetical protein
MGLDFRTRLLGAAKLAHEAKSGTTALHKLGTAGKEAGDKAKLGSSGWSIFSKRTSDADKSVKKTKGSMGSLIGTLGGFGAAWIGFSGAKDAISTTTELADETLKLSRATGMSTMAASQWVAVAKVHDISGTTLGRTFGMLSKNIAEARKQEELHASAMTKHRESSSLSLSSVGFGKGSMMRKQQAEAKAQIALRALEAKGAGVTATAFKKLGITTKDLQGANTNLGPLMVKLSAAFNKLHGGAERNALANRIFGRSYQQILPLFREGNESLETNLKWAKKYGVAFGGSSPRELKKFLVAQDEAKYATLGLQIAFTKYLAPSLMSLLKLWPKMLLSFKEGRGVWGPLKAGVSGAASVLKTSAGWISKNQTAAEALGGALVVLGALWGVKKIDDYVRALKGLLVVQAIAKGLYAVAGAETSAAAATVGLSPLLAGLDKLAKYAGPLAAVALAVESIKKGTKSSGKSQGPAKDIEGFLTGGLLGNPSTSPVGLVTHIFQGSHKSASSTPSSKHAHLLSRAPGPHIKGLAAGGIIARSGRVIVGEHGKEELNLPTAARVTPLPRAGAGGMLSLISQLVVDGKHLAEAYDEVALNDAARA